jgi:quercetin dioxygenase-like cupin family protein
MEIKNISQSSPSDPEKYVAEEFLEGEQSNVRIIKLARGTSLPPHRHGESDLMLFVSSGSALLETEAGVKEIGGGDMVFISHTDELRVSNPLSDEAVFLALLTPKFPPRS